MKEDTTCKTPRWRMLKSQLNNLSSEAFAEIMKRERVAIIDVRTPKEYKASHIPNALNLDYLAEDFLDNLMKLEKDKYYLIYCRSGRRSLRVCTWMRNGGFDNNKVFNLDKGFKDWIVHFPEAIA